VNRRKRIQKEVIFLILIVGVLLITVLFIYSRVKTDKITNLVDNKENLTVLIMITEDNTVKYTELFLYNSNTRKGSLFDLPGNVGSVLATVNKMGRIDSLFDSGKPTAYIKKIEALTGLTVPFYMILEKTELAGVIDLFGGVKLFIPNPVEILNKADIVLLPSGNVTLDGEKAIVFMDYKESGEADSERISRRQRVLQALFTAVSQQNWLLDSRKVDNLLYSLIDTNLNKTALTGLFKEFNKLDSDKMVFQRVLGTNRTIGNDVLLFPYYEGKLLKETVVQTVASLANTEIQSNAALHMKIDILNGTEQNGLAGRTSEIFKRFGYDIINLGNYSTNNLKQTIVVSRTMDSAAAGKIAEIIKCKNVQFSNTVDISNVNILNDNSDVIVILGKDFDGRYCKD